MSHSTVIRGARREDIPPIARLCGELGYASNDQQTGRRFERIAADPDHRILVAEQADGEVVGWLHVQLTKALESDPRGEVVGLVVTAAARRRGLGRQLIEAAESWTREHNGRELRVRCNVTRGETHKFYARLGYEIAKTQHAFQRRL